MSGKTRKSRINRMLRKDIDRNRGTIGIRKITKDFHDLKDDLRRYHKRYETKPMAKEGPLQDDLKIFISGKPYYDYLIEDISKAKEDIYIETYILRADHTGNRLKEALIAARGRGCKVRLVCDSWGGKYVPEGYWKELHAAGVRIMHFHPLRRFVKSRNIKSFLRRDHRKVVIIDKDIGYLGGMNIADEYTRWRDCQLRIKGPSVRYLVLAAKEMTYIIRKRRYYYSRKVVLNLIQQMNFRGPLRIIRDIPTIFFQYIKREIIKMIAKSKDYVYITTAYFVPDWSLIYEITEAAKRGIDVRILLSARSDVELVKFASRTFYSRLLKSGVRIYEYQPTFNHQKTIVSDDMYSTVGSANLNSRSARFDYEINAFIKDKQMARRLRSIFMEDLERSKEIRLRRWKERPLKEKITERLCILLRSVI